MPSNFRFSNKFQSLIKWKQLTVCISIMKTIMIMIIMMVMMIMLVIIIIIIITFCPLHPSSLLVVSSCGNISNHHHQSSVYHLII